MDRSQALFFLAGSAVTFLGQWVGEQVVRKMDKKWQAGLFVIAGATHIWLIFGPPDLSLAELTPSIIFLIMIYRGVLYRRT